MMPKLDVVRWRPMTIIPSHAATFGTVPWPVPQSKEALLRTVSSHRSAQRIVQRGRNPIFTMYLRSDAARLLTVQFAIRALLIGAALRGQTSEMRVHLELVLWQDRIFLIASFVGRSLKIVRLKSVWFLAARSMAWYWSTGYGRGGNLSERLGIGNLSRFGEMTQAWLWDCTNIIHGKMANIFPSYSRIETLSHRPLQISQAYRSWTLNLKGNSQFTLWMGLTRMTVPRARIQINPKTFLHLTRFEGKSVNLKVGGMREA